MKCIRCKSGAGGVRLCVDCRTSLRAAGLDPVLVAGLFEEAATFLRLGEHASAVRVLQRLLRRDPQNLVAHEILILAYGFLNRFERGMTALASMHRALPCGPTTSSRVPLRKKRVASRRHPLGAEVEELPQPVLLQGAQEAPNVSAMLDLALFYRQMRQLELADVLLERVLELEPASPEAQLLQGSIARVRGQVREALEHFEAIPHGEACAAVQYERGLCYESLGRNKRALRLVASAVQLEPDNPYMHFTLGTLHEKVGQPERARREYRVAASLHAGFAPALVDLSFRQGLAALDDGLLEQAAVAFDQGVVESTHLFDPVLYGELEQLLDGLVCREAWEDYRKAAAFTRRLAPPLLGGLEQAVSAAAHLGFYVGLASYWDQCYETQSHDHGGSSCDVYGPLQATEETRYELPETEASWLAASVPGGRVLRGVAVPPVRLRYLAAAKEAVSDDLEDEAARVRAEVTRPEAQLGFPPVPFPYVLETWLQARTLLSAPQIQDRPLASPQDYQRLVKILGSSVCIIQEMVREQLPEAFPEDEEDVSQATADLAMLLWSVVVDGYLLRVALDRCRAFPQDVLVRFGVAARFQGQRYFSRALHELDEAQRMLPASAALLKQRWTLCIRDGQHAQAAELCHQALALTPHPLFQAIAFNDLAHCMAELDVDPRRALLYTEKARELAPPLCEISARETAAWLAYRQGRPEEALEAMERCLALAQEQQGLDATTSIHHYHHGHILRTLGREQEAQAAFERACALEKDAESDWGIARRLQRPPDAC